MSKSLTAPEVKQIEATEPKSSKKLFDQYLHQKYTLQQLADNNGMKLHQIQKYSRSYKYVARRKYYQNLKKGKHHNHHHQKQHQQYFKICPECRSCNFKYDDIHHEVYCSSCGLVIISPPSADFITDGYAYLFIDTNFYNIEVIVVEH